MTKEPRPHAETIKAWAEGADIQYRKDAGSEWVDVADPAWVTDYEYRVKPAREYPETQMKQADFNKAMGFGPASVEVCTKVANAALRHAIDNGQVVTREEFGRATSYRAERDLAVSIAVRDKCAAITVGHAMRSGVVDDIKCLDLFAIIDAVKS